MYNLSKYINTACSVCLMLHICLHVCVLMHLYMNASMYVCIYRTNHLVLDN